ncbi:MAG TPA: hypothetical protein VNN77_06260 [candidate division Zixibacteria bacterium]|nr:hypothetical protein [candidate division Zixibacteria bacterium]
MSPLTVRQWVKAGLLRAHYQLVSGRTLKLLFANRDLVRFFDENFPSSADLAGSDFDPRSSRSQRIQKMLAAKRLYARRRTPRAQGAGEPQ